MWCFIGTISLLSSSLSTNIIPSSVRCLKFSIPIFSQMFSKNILPSLCFLKSSLWKQYCFKFGGSSSTMANIDSSYRYFSAITSRFYFSVYFYTLSSFKIFSLYVRTFSGSVRKFVFLTPSLLALATKCSSYSPFKIPLISSGRSYCYSSMCKCSSKLFGLSDGSKALISRYS